MVNIWLEAPYDKQALTLQLVEKVFLRGKAMEVISTTEKVNRNDASLLLITQAVQGTKYKIKQKNEVLFT